MAKHKSKKDGKSGAPRRTKSGRGVRSFWSGTITFGLVTIPVNLYPASRSSGVSFRMLGQDGTPLQRRFYCPDEEKDVHPEHLLRGYELDNGEYVIVRDEELEAVEPRKTREIDLRRFVKLEEISPLMFNRAYFMTPDGVTTKAYRLLASILEEQGRAGIATFVMRDREYLIAILAEHGILRAETLRFQDELRTPESLPLPKAGKVARKDVARMEKLVDRMTVETLDTSLLKDEYAERVRAAVEEKRKQRGAVVTANAGATATEDEEGDAVDLLDAIRRSLQATAGRHGRGAKAAGRSKKERPAKRGSGKATRRQRAPREDLQDASKNELYARAKQLDIPGRSQLNKKELIREISRVTNGRH